MIHLSKYMKLQVFYKTNQWILMITKSFEFRHQAEYFRAVIFLRALDLEEHILIVCIFYIVLYKIHSETSGGLCNFTIYLEWLKFVYWENIYLVDPTTSKVNPTCFLHCRLSRSQWYCITNSPIKIFQVILISILITNLLTIFFCWKPLKFNHCKCFKNLADLFLSWETQ